MTGIKSIKDQVYQELSCFEQHRGLVTNWLVRCLSGQRVAKKKQKEAMKGYVCK